MAGKQDGVSVLFSLASRVKMKKGCRKCVNDFVNNIGMISVVTY